MSRKRKKQAAPTPRQKVHFEPQDRSASPGALAGGSFYSRSYAGVPVTHESALSLSTYWACVRAIASPLGYMGCHIRQQSLNGRGSQVMSSHPADWVLSRQANPETSSFTFRETATAWALTWGNGYAEIEQDGAGRLSWLWQITPDRVQPCRTRDTGELVYDIANRHASNVVLPASKVFHLKGMGYDGTVGYSVVDYARQSIALGLATERFGAEFFGNGMHPSGVAEMPGQLSNDAVLRLQKSIHEQLKLAHNVLILEDGTKWNSVTIPPENAQFLETRQFQGPEMCRWFGVPPHKIFDLSRATFCLPGDAQVFTEYGPKNIADVQVGEKVWSHNPADPSTWVLSSVEKTGCTGEDEILTIKCRNRTLRCNAKHRVAVRERIYVPYEGGKGQYLVIDGKPVRREWVMNWVEAGDLKPGDQLLGVDDLPEQGSDSCPTREYVSPEFMEVLGLLLGDGFYARNANGTGSTFGISHGEHDSYLPFYIAAIEKEFRAYAGPYGRTNGETAPLRAVRRDKNTTVFYSGLAYDELAECGMVGTAKTKRVPRWVFALTRQLKLAFLRGYLDADGTVNERGQIRYVSVNKELLDDVRHLCISAGITVGNLFSHEIESHFEDYGTYRHRLYGFICTDVEHNAEIGSYTTLYNERIATRRQAIKQRTCTVYPNEQKRYWCGAGLFATRIQSIEKSASKEPVYDLTVSGTHCFVADLLLVHNSNIEHLAIEYVTDALVPWVERWEQEADLKLFGANRSRLYTKFNVAALLRGDLQSRYAAYAIGRQWGWLSVNDIRELEDMNPLPPHIGDTYLVPLNMMALSLDPHAPPILPPKPNAPPNPQGPPDEILQKQLEGLSEGQRLLAQAMVKMLERDVTPPLPTPITVSIAPSPLHLQVEMAAPAISLATPEVHNHMRVDMPEPQVHVQVDGATVNVPQANVNVDTRIDMPERPLQVNVDGATIHMPEQQVHVDNHLTMPERQVNVQVEGPHISAPDHSQVTVNNTLAAPEPQPIALHVAAPQVIVPEREVHVHNAVTQSIDVPEQPVHVQIEGSQITVPEREVHVENRVDVPERQVHVSVDSPVSVPEREVRVENRVDVPERQVHVQVDSPVTVPDRKVQVTNRVNVPERQITVQQSGSQIVVPEREVHTHVTLPEQTVAVQVEGAHVEIPEREVRVEARIEAPEQQITVHAEPQITVPEREVRVENRIEAPEHQITVHAEPQITVPEREVVVQMTQTVEPPPPAAPADPPVAPVVNVVVESPTIQVAEREVTVHVEVPERQIVIQQTNEITSPEQPISIQVEAPQITIPDRDVTVNIENAPRVELPEPHVNVTVEAPQITVPERELTVNVAKEEALVTTPIKFRDTVIRGKDREIIKIEREVLETRELPPNHILQFSDTVKRDAEHEIVEIIREAVGLPEEPPKGA